MEFQLDDLLLGRTTPRAINRALLTYLASSISGEDFANDVLKVETQFNYTTIRLINNAGVPAYIINNGTTTNFTGTTQALGIKGTPGFLHSIHINNITAFATATLNELYIHDHASAASNRFQRLPIPAAGVNNLQRIEYDNRMTQGIQLVNVFSAITGCTAGEVEIIFQWR